VALQLPLKVKTLVHHLVKKGELQPGKIKNVLITKDESDQEGKPRSRGKGKARQKENKETRSEKTNQKDSKEKEKKGAQSKGEQKYVQSLIKVAIWVIRLQVNIRTCIVMHNIM